MKTRKTPEFDDLKSYPFNLDFIIQDLRLQRNAFEEFDSMATNKEAKQAHLDATIPLTSPPNPNPYIISGESLIRAATISAIEMAHPVYRLQIIVSIQTQIEKLVREFFIKLFLCHPSRMHDYVQPSAPNSPIGYVKLSEILEFSKQELINKLADSAAKRISDLPFAKVLKLVSKHSEYPGNMTLFNEINEISLLRNRIVHEGYSPILNKEKILEGYDATEMFGLHCGAALKHSGVIVNFPNFPPIRSAQ